MMLKVSKVMFKKLIFLKIFPNFQELLLMIKVECIVLAGKVKVKKHKNGILNI